MVGSSNARIGTVDIVSWGGGTYKQISKMLDAHYKGTIDISDYWEVGDTREIEITDVLSDLYTLKKNNSSTYRYYTLGSQPSQTTKLVIIGMNHDDLFEPINGINKAAVTLQTLDALSESLSSMNRYSDEVSLESIYGLWRISPIRIWCNKYFIDSLPKPIFDIIKPVYKLSNCVKYDSVIDSVGQESTVDKCFILSQGELTGENTCQVIGTSNAIYDDMLVDGDQYDYFKTENSRIKYNNGTAVDWYLRTSYSTTYIHHEIIKSDGTFEFPISGNYISYLAPAFCL